MIFTADELLEPTFDRIDVSAPETAIADSMMPDVRFENDEPSSPVRNSTYTTRAIYITFPTAYQPSESQNENPLRVTGDARSRTDPDTSLRGKDPTTEEPFNKTQPTSPIQAGELEAEHALREDFRDRQMVESDGFEESADDSGNNYQVILHGIGTGERYF
jgi:hypothetical protein